MTDISIIIPTLNRDDILGEALEAIAAVVGPGDPVEIMVVDNGSTDRTAAVCATARERHPRLDWRYIYDDMPGLLTGRHRGADEAKGEVLAYLDDDAIVAASWLEALREGFRDPELALMGGPSRPRYEAEPPDWLATFWWDREEGRSCGPLSLSDLGQKIRPIDPCMVWGLNFIIRKSVLRQCGGFHPDCIPSALQRYQGDGETGLGMTIKARGLPTLYHPELAVTHVIPGSRMTATAFEKRGFYQGICDSYTTIRENRAAASASPSWKAAVRPLKGALIREYFRRRSDARAVAQLMSRAHIAGAAFHQQEVRNDPGLLEWVLRPDYFDYRLPEDWRARMGLADTPPNTVQRRRA